MSHYFSPVHQKGDVVVWAADRYLFAYDLVKKEFLVERNDHHEASIRSISSCNGKWVTGGDDKKVVSWDASWKPTTHTSQKKITAVLQLEDRILFADKYGDVWALENGNATVLLGHLAIITQMALVENGKFLVTADNCDKIRISRYPEVYVIHAFCLGHSNIITKVLASTGSFVTLSTDMTLRIWDMSGEEQKSIKLPADASPCDGLITADGDHCLVLFQDTDKLHRINLTTGAVEEGAPLPSKAQALVSETMYISTTGHLKSLTDPSLDVFSGEDVGPVMVNFIPVNENKENPEEEEEGEKMKRSRKKARREKLEEKMQEN